MSRQDPHWYKTLPIWIINFCFFFFTGGEHREVRKMTRRQISDDDIVQMMDEYDVSDLDGVLS